MAKTKQAEATLSDKAKQGRPSKYREEFCLAVEYMAKAGMTDAQMAEKLEISEASFHVWKKEYPQFLEAIKRGKEEPDDIVERSLFERATGYVNRNAVKIFMPAGADSPVYAPYEEHVAPDVTAQIFWLKNRRPEAWRDKQELKHTGGISVTLSALDAKL